MTFQTLKKPTPRQREKQTPFWAIQQNVKAQIVGIESFKNFDLKRFTARLLEDRKWNNSSLPYMPDIHQHYYQLLYVYPELAERLNVILTELNKTVFKDIVRPCIFVRDDKATFGLFFLSIEPRVHNRFVAYSQVYKRLTRFCKEVWITLKLPDTVGRDA